MLRPGGLQKLYNRLLRGIGCRGEPHRRIPRDGPQRGVTVRPGFRAWSNVVREMRYIVGLLLVVWTLIAGLSTGCAQDVEPRAYSNAPVGVNFLIMGYAYTQGGLAFDPSLPVKNPQLETSNTIMAYARVLDLWGKSAKLQLIMPYTWLSGSADYMGQRVKREVDGLADPSFRLSVNLYGAPALTLKEFKDYKQDLIIGASLLVSAPWGQYDSSKLVNIGTNRWSFRPEVGVSKALGPLTLEVAAAATLCTDNNDFFGGNTRSQAPLYLMPGHLIYSFPWGIWASIDATYFTGGRTTLNGILSNDLQENSRLGGTLAFPVNASNSIKLYASSGVSARTGNNYDLIGIVWQYRWGGADFNEWLSTRMDISSQPLILDRGLCPFMQVPMPG